MQYALPGTRQYQERLYPNPALLDPCTRLKLKSFVDVITHLTASSLAEDGILIKDGSLGVTEGAPLMLVERTAYARSGLPLEFARDLFRGDRTKVVVWTSELAGEL